MKLQSFLRRSSYLPYLAATVAVALVCGPTILSTWQDSLRRTERASRALADAHILASSIRDDLASNDQVAIEKRIRSWERDPELETVAVLDPGGKQVAAFARDGAPNVPGSLRQGIVARQGDVEVVVPVMTGSRHLGTVYLRDTPLRTWRRVAEYVPIVLLAFTAAVLVSVLAVAQLWLVRSNVALLAEKEERSRAEQALRRSQKLDAIGQVASAAAHDFNNLLVIVQSYLSRIRRTLITNPAEAEGYVAGATGALFRASALSQRLLAVSRFQAIDPEPIDLNELVLDLLDFVRLLVDDRIKISTSLEATWLTVCDWGEMENVILNLVINARDAMPKGGELKIASRNVPAKISLARGDSERVELRVTDTGIGMSAETVKRATEPFFTTKPPGKGTGLGLSAARGYIHQAHGELYIESTPGHGTTIIIGLPRTRMSGRTTQNMHTCVDTAQIRSGEPGPPSMSHRRLPEGGQQPQSRGAS